jgi:hypothetical protein
MPNDWEYLHGKDLHYNNHRKKYGALPAIDCDMIEFDQYDKPVLFQELKHCKIGEIRLADLNKHINIAKGLHIPLILTTYYFLHRKENGNLVGINADQDLIPDHIQYHCYPVWSPSGSMVPHLLPPKGKMLSEREYIILLHRIKGTTEPCLDSFFSHIESDCVDCFEPEII